MWYQFNTIADCFVVLVLVVSVALKLASLKPINSMFLQIQTPVVPLEIHMIELLAHLKF